MKRPRTRRPVVKAHPLRVRTIPNDKLDHVQGGVLAGGTFKVEVVVDDYVIAGMGTEVTVF